MKKWHWLPACEASKHRLETYATLCNLSKPRSGKLRSLLLTATGRIPDVLYPQRQHLDLALRKCWYEKLKSDTHGEDLQTPPFV